MDRRALLRALLWLILIGQAAAATPVMGQESAIAAASEVLPSRPPQPPANIGRVGVSSVALLTLLMALCSGLGALPFFFFDLKHPSYRGICNGVACGVMLAASFGLIHEGRGHGDGGCVVGGICLGSLFIVLSEKVLAQFGEVKHLDLRGAGARRVALFVIIMTLHAFGEGAGVGVSFAGPKGLPQGILVTVAIAVHNIPEGMAVSMVMNGKGMRPRSAFLWSIATSLPQPLVAVPAFLFAETFSKFLPICMGFAAGCMIWIVFAELLPESLAEASPTAIAAAATLSVAFMELVSAVMDTLESPMRGASRGSTMQGPMLWSLLFGLGPCLGGLAVIGILGIVRLSQAFLVGSAAGVLSTLAFARPMQLLLGGQFGALPISCWLVMGALLFIAAARALTMAVAGKQKQEREEVLKAGRGQLLTTPLAKATALVAGALGLHAFVEGLVLGVAAEKAEGNIGARMLLPVVLHSLPRGAAVAAAIYAASGSRKGGLLGATLIGFGGPAGAVLAIGAGMVSASSLDRWMLLACGGLLPAARFLVPRTWQVNQRGTAAGFVAGAALVLLSLAGTRSLCLNTPYCNSAPEAIT